MLAMTYMYHGRQEFGIELARKVWHNLVCQQGYTWDMPNIMRGDVDTGERTFGNDYYQDMMLWRCRPQSPARELTPRASRADWSTACCRPGREVTDTDGVSSRRRSARRASLTVRAA